MKNFKENFEYPITIEGIEMADSNIQSLADNKPQIMIKRSLTNYSQSKYLSNT